MFNCAIFVSRYFRSNQVNTFHPFGLSAILWKGQAQARPHLLVFVSLMSHLLLRVFLLFLFSFISCSAQENERTYLWMREAQLNFGNRSYNGMVLDGFGPNFQYKDNVPVYSVPQGQNFAPIWCNNLT